MSSQPHLHTGTSDLDARIPSAVLRALASSDPVVIRGDGSPGTSRLARAIHDGSIRRRGPFEYLACRNMPDLLVASELVGHREGSFPGAVRDKRSALAWRAHEGTLVIGDVAAIGPQSRRAVASLIRCGDVVPVGAQDSAGKVDVRVILMSDGPLDASVLEALGAFLEIHVPAAKDRDPRTSNSPHRMLKANDF
jgi:DNA-binding NtrC family response regulator